MATRSCRLAISVAVLLLVGLPAAAQIPDNPADLEDMIERARKLARTFGANEFVRYHESMNPGNLVVFGRLKKVTASRKKRVSDDEVVQPGVLGKLGGNVSRSVARYGRSTFYHASGKSVLLVDGVLFGPPASDKLKINYKVQIEKTAKGETHFMMLGENPRVIEAGLFGLWVLKPAKKPRGSFDILRPVPYVQKPGSAASALAAFKKRQADYFEVNAAIRLLSDAIKIAEGFYENEKPAEATAVLKEVLEDKLKIKSLEFEDEAKRLVKPYRRKAEQMLKTLEAKAKKGAEKQAGGAAGGG